MSVLDGLLPLDDFPEREEGLDLGVLVDHEPYEVETFCHFADDGTETVLLIDVETGEVVGEPNEPLETSDARDIAAYVGPRLRAAEARLEGIRAERDARLRQVAARYDRQIRREETAILRYKTRYFDTLRRFALSIGLDSAKKRSTSLGDLVLAFRKKPGRIDVADESTAVAWAKLACPEAVKVKESVLVSRIPADMELSPEASGMVRVSPVDTFEVK